MNTLFRMTDVVKHFRTGRGIVLFRTLINDETHILILLQARFWALLANPAAASPRSLGLPCAS